MPAHPPNPLSPAPYRSWAWPLVPEPKSSRHAPAPAPAHPAPSAPARLHARRVEATQDRSQLAQSVHSEAPALQPDLLEAPPLSSGQTGSLESVRLAYCWSCSLSLRWCDRCQPRSVPPFRLRASERRLLKLSPPAYHQCQVHSGLGTGLLLLARTIIPTARNSGASQLQAHYLARRVTLRYPCNPRCWACVRHPHPWLRHHAIRAVPESPRTVLSARPAPRLASPAAIAWRSA